ncbi:MAG: hypothetical protein WC547_06595 [Candidatus Omnitrophota bacterium]
MAYSAITDAQIASGEPITASLMDKIQDNFSYLYGLIGSAGQIGVPNGSFEIDSDADGVPDSWTKNLYAGGTGGIYTTSPAHGAQSFYFTHPGGGGNGGGYLTSDYVECSPNLNHILSFILWSTAAGMKNKVQIQFYTKAKAENGAAVDLYSSTANPTSATVFNYGIKPTASSAYFKIILHGGVDDTDVAGTTYFDDIRLIGHFPDVTAGDVIVASDKAEESGTEDAYTKYKEIRILRDGTYKTSFELKAGAAQLVRARIYVNGVGVGTEQDNNTTDYVVFEEDMATLNAGDLVQLYCKDATGGVTFYVKNFYLAISSDVTCAVPL